MIQVNTTLNTKGGLTIGTGSLVNVTPHIIDYVDVNGLTKYDITYDTKIYKDMAAYLSGTVLVQDEMKEFNVGYIESNVDIQGLNPSANFVDTILGFLQTHIEQGDYNYIGTGTSSTLIVYPSI